MELQYLREFLEVAKTKNISQAARNIFVTQSTLTRHIQALEREAGLPLIHSTSHGITLTPVGEEAKEVFRTILAEYDAWQARSIRKLTGTLTFGVMYYLLDVHFSEFLEYFQEKYPGVQLICRTNYQPQALLDDLQAGQLDVASGLCYREHVPAGMRFQSIGHTGLIAMMCQSDPLAKSNTITASDLNGRLRIDLAHDAYSNHLTEHFLRESGVIPGPVIYADNIETVPAKLRTGGGIHITGENCRKQGAERIAYRSIQGSHALYHIGILARTEANPLVELFWKEIQKFYLNHDKRS